MNYEEALSKIPFYEIHPSLKPFIGEKYDEYKILIVGESHYINQKPKTQKYTIDHFATNWWNGSCSEMDADENCQGWYDTRSVVNNYLKGKRDPASSIFTNVVKPFSKIVLNQPIEYISTEESQKFNYFSFMNFFQMPSLFFGKSFKGSLYENGANIEVAKCVWEKARNVSITVCDSVIDVIKPRVIIFVSSLAYDTFHGSNANHKNDKNVVRVCHPGCPWWYRKRKSDGKCGKDDFESYLKEYLG